MNGNQTCQRFIYKLQSRRLAESGWNLSLPLSAALHNKNDVVAAGDSQLLRWIMELNGNENLDKEISSLKLQLKELKKNAKGEEAKKTCKRVVQEDVYSPISKRLPLPDYGFRKRLSQGKQRIFN